MESQYAHIKRTILLSKLAEMESPKKRRAQNFTTADSLLLTQLMGEDCTLMTELTNHAFLKHRYNDCITGAGKKEVWANIVDKFNASADVKRNISELTKKWENLVIKHRKEYSDFQKSMIASGGRHMTELSQLTETIINVVGWSIVNFPGISESMTSSMLTLPVAGGVPLDLSEADSEDHHNKPHDVSDTCSEDLNVKLHDVSEASSDDMHGKSLDVRDTVDGDVKRQTNKQTGSKDLDVKPAYVCDTVLEDHHIIKPLSVSQAGTNEHHLDKVTSTAASTSSTSIITSCPDCLKEKKEIRQLKKRKLELQIKIMEKHLKLK